VAELHRRRLGLQLRELGPDALTVLLGHPHELDGREDLPELHRCPLHLTELIHERLGDREIALVGGVLAVVVVAREIGQARQRPARALPGGEAAQTRPSLRATARQAPGLVSHATLLAAVGHGSTVP